ncbi:hypothetical protein [Enterobacter sp.]|uniref:hypothetical protein n=1 Tax=Enterobacter sp. TaxID=42895 RepID=UPI0029818F52|nr:hypothetical protein [Enterobacter sp.]
MKMQMTNKAKLMFLSLLIFIFIAILFPLILYVINMPGGLSHKNEDWGDFGSFVGGIYGSFFSSLSLMVVSIAALETYRSNKEQMLILRNDQSFNQFNILLSNLRASFPTRYDYSENETRVIADHYSSFRLRLGISVVAHYDDQKTVEQNLIDYASVYYLQHSQLLFDKPAKLFTCIIDVIRKAPNDLSNAFKIIFENNFNEYERLCLEYYTRAYHPGTISFLDNWSSLSQIPSDSIRTAEQNLRLNGVLV